MVLRKLKWELSTRSKNGIPFLLSATIIWAIITIIFLQDFHIQQKNIFMLFSTGIMLPLAILFSKIIKAEWKTNDHPLGELGLLFNIAQFMYFPLIFWAFAKSPEEMVLFFAVITGAHFFLYGWLYDTKAYYIMSPVISGVLIVIGWTIHENNLWLIPFCMVVFLFILIIWLSIDYKQKKTRLT